MTKTSQPKTEPKAESAIRPSTELTGLIDEYKALFDFANEDLEHTDPRTRPGKHIRKMEAQEKLAAVKVRYVAALKKGLAAIFLDGNPEDVAFFAKVAEEEGPAIVVSASAVYERLGDEVESNMRTDRMFEPSQFARMLGELTVMGKEMGIYSMASPKFVDGALLKDRAAVIAHVRKLVREAAKDDLLTMILTERIAEAALKIHYLHNVVPVVVTGATPEERAGLASFFNNRSISVTAEGQDSKAVLEAFSRIAKIAKSR